MVCASVLVTALAAMRVAIAFEFAAAVQSQLVIHKEGTSEYHRPWCPVVRDGRKVVALTRGQAEARGLKSHPACEKDPGADGGGFPGAEGTKGTAPPQRQSVYVDGSKYYHREKCDRAVGPLSKTALDIAARTRWPCPACRPPIRKKSEGPAIPKRGARN